jgi:type IV secretory pathway VirB3-like protein
MVKILGLLNNLTIQIHGIPYIFIFIIMKNNVMNAINELCHVVRQTLVERYQSFP